MATEGGIERSVDEGADGEADGRRSTETLVGIPAYDEAVGIGSTVLSSLQYADRVVVVDDGSADATAKIAERAGAAVISHEENSGKGVAIRTLLDHARTSDCDAFVLLDADGQHVPEDIPSVAAPVLADEADLVIGSRYVEETSGETPIVRRVGQRVLDGLLKATTGIEITDTQCGFRALSPTAIDTLTLEMDGMGVESEMIDNAVREELRIREVPIEARYTDIDGQTFHPILHGLTVVHTILRLFWRRNSVLISAVVGVAAAVGVWSSIRALRRDDGGADAASGEDAAAAEDSSADEGGVDIPLVDGSNGRSGLASSVLLARLSSWRGR